MSPVRAAQAVSPFQGCSQLIMPDPRVSPWALLRRPFRAYHLHGRLQHQAHLGISQWSRETRIAALGASAAPQPMLLSDVPLIARPVWRKGDMPLFPACQSNSHCKLEKRNIPNGTKIRISIVTLKGSGSRAQGAALGTDAA